MKKLLSVTLIAFTIFLISCGKSGVTVKLSLYETDYFSKHYIKTEIHNNTGKDIFIPYFGYNYLSAYYNDVDMTAMIDPKFSYEDLDYYIYLKTGRIILVDEIFEFDTLKYKGFQRRIESLFEKEREQFMIYNKIDSTDVSEFEKERERYYAKILDLDYTTNASEKGWTYMRKYVVDLMANAIYNMKYGSGTFMKAGEVIEKYYPIDSLYCGYKNKLKNDFIIKFTRRSFSEMLVYDTTDYYFDEYSHRFKLILTDYPDTIAGYELYTGEIKCKDVIHLKATD